MLYRAAQCMPCCAALCCAVHDTLPSLAAHCQATWHAPASIYYCIPSLLALPHCPQMGGDRPERAGLTLYLDKEQRQ